MELFIEQLLMKNSIYIFNSTSKKKKIFKRRYNDHLKNKKNLACDLKNQYKEKAQNDSSYALFAFSLGIASKFH